MEMEEWHDQIPNAPDLGDAAANERKPPYSIIVSIMISLYIYIYIFVAGLSMLMQFSGLDADGWSGSDFLVVVDISLFLNRIDELDEIYERLVLQMSQ